MGCATVARLRRAEKCIRERSSVEAAVGGTQRPPERVGAQHQRRGHGCGDNQRVIKGAYVVAHGKQALPRGAPLQQCRQLVAALHLPVARWVSCAVRFVGSATRAVCEALAQGLHTAACPYKMARSLNRRRAKRTKVGAQESRLCRIERRHPQPRRHAKHRQQGRPQNLLEQRRLDPARRCERGSTPSLVRGDCVRTLRAGQNAQSSHARRAVLPSVRRARSSVQAGVWGRPRSGRAPQAAEPAAPVTLPLTARCTRRAWRRLGRRASPPCSAPLPPPLSCARA